MSIGACSGATSNRFCIQAFTLHDGKKITDIRLSPDTRYFFAALPGRCSFRNFGLRLLYAHLPKRSFFM